MNDFWNDRLEHQRAAVRSGKGDEYSMKMIGYPKWNTRVDNEEGRNKFKSIYSIDPYHYMVNHEIFHISRVYSDQKKYIAFVEGDEVNLLLILRDNEHLKVYSDGCMGDDAIFNTDGIAFYQLIRDCKIIAMWAVDQSPFDVLKEDADELEYDYDALIKEISKMAEEEVDESEVLLVGQL